MSEPVVDQTMWDGSLHVNLPGTFLNRPRIKAEAEALRHAGASAAFVGFPWDGTCISRTGTNFGPRGLREASEQFLTYNFQSDMDLADEFNIVDCGDVPIVPGNSERTQSRAQEMIAALLEADVMPIIGGGDHFITIGPVRAFTQKYRRCGMIHFDTHLVMPERVPVRLAERILHWEMSSIDHAQIRACHIIFAETGSAGYLKRDA